MHAKPDLRVFLKWMIAGSGSVITDVIPLMETAMKIQAIFVVCCISALGCNGSTNSSSTNGPDEVLQVDSVGNIESALSKISVGTLDSDLVAMLKPHSLDSGTVYWGGTGARRMYFQIAVDKQIWFELSGPADGNRVTVIGKIEPKTKWTRHDGGSITVES